MRRWLHEKTHSLKTQAHRRRPSNMETENWSTFFEISNILFLCRYNFGCTCSLLGGTALRQIKMHFYCTNKKGEDHVVLERCNFSCNFGRLRQCWNYPCLFIAIGNRQHLQYHELVQKKVGLGSNISKEDLVLRKINFHLQYYWLWSSRENYHAIR